MTARQSNYPELASTLGEDDALAFIGQLDGHDILLPANEYRPYPVRGHLWQAEQPSRGRMLLLPGFTEFCEKYALFVRRLVVAGYDCLIIDWPGQGRSGQLGAHQLVVHIDRFSAFYEALDELLIAANWKDRRFSLFGHSMGGHLGLGAARIYPHLIDRLVLCAPMIVPRSPPVWLTQFLAHLLLFAGWRYRTLPFAYMPNLSMRRKFKPNNWLTRFPEGYDRQYKIFEKHPELRRVYASVGWIRAAFESCVATTLKPDWMASVDIPVLALLPEDERVVDPLVGHRMLSFLPDCRMVSFPGARHELLSETPEVTSRIYAEMDKFLSCGSAVDLEMASGAD